MSPPSSLSIVARLPLAMFSIGLLVHAQHLTGSFAAAGLVTAAYAVALGVGGPLLGRVVDRRGQTAVLLASAVVAGAGARRRSRCCRRARPRRSLVALAARDRRRDAAGRRLRAHAAAGRSRGAFAGYLEATAVELTWVFGPPLALLARARCSRPARRWRARARVLVAGDAGVRRAPGLARLAAGAEVARPRGGSLRAPAMRTLVLVMVAVGVAVRRGRDRRRRRRPTRSAPPPPPARCWASGAPARCSAASWLARRGAARTGAGLVLLLAALAAGHLALVARRRQRGRAGRACSSLAGAAIAPTYAAPSTRWSSASRPPARSPRRSPGCHRGRGRRRARRRAGRQPGRRRRPGRDLRAGRRRRCGGRRDHRHPHAHPGRRPRLDYPGAPVRRTRVHRHRLPRLRLPRHLGAARTRADGIRDRAVEGSGLLEAQARGDADAVLAALPACRAHPACAQVTRDRVAELRGPVVQILTYDPSVRVALTRQTGTGRVAWRAGVRCRSCMRAGAAGRSVDRRRGGAALDLGADRRRGELPGLGEQPPESRGLSARLLCESVPGDAHDPEPGFDEVGVFGAVGLEVVVELFAVELGNQLFRGRVASTS